MYASIFKEEAFAHKHCAGTTLIRLRYFLARMLPLLLAQATEAVRMACLALKLRLAPCREHLGLSDGALALKDWQTLAATAAGFAVDLASECVHSACGHGVGCNNCLSSTRVAHQKRRVCCDCTS